MKLIITEEQYIKLIESNSKKLSKFLEKFKEIFYQPNKYKRFNIYPIKNNIENWPDIKYSEDGKYEDEVEDKSTLSTEKLDLENYGMLELTNDKFVFWAGGDWQPPFTVTIKLVNNKLKVTECKPHRKGDGKELKLNDALKTLGVYDDYKEFKKETDEKNFNEKIDKYVLEYNEWNNQKESEFKAPTESSVLEFMLNNYEYESDKKGLLKKLLKKLKNEYSLDEDMFCYTLTSHLFEDNTPKREFNGFSGRDLSSDEIKRLYILFKQSYENSIGVSWSFDKFARRIYNWYLYGNSDGFATVKNQGGGLLKLTGSAGNPKGILNGLQKITNTNKPIWGVVTPGIANTLINRGFIRPNKEIMDTLFKYIPRSAFGDSETTLNPDGNLTYSSSDVGTMEKTFVANKEYFNFIINNPMFQTDMTPEIKNKLISIINQ